MKTRKARASIPPFQSGQVWQMGDANLEIGLVGKRLVHYKHYKAKAKRPPTQLSGKAALEKFLHQQRAILLQKAPAEVETAGRRTQPSRKPGRVHSAASQE